MFQLRVATVVLGAAVAVVACHPPRSAMTVWPALDEQLLADATATFNFKLGAPTPLAITKDGAVLFRRTPGRSFAADLYELSADGKVKPLATVDELLGATEEKLSDEEKARRERTRTATRGVVDIDVSTDGKTVMVPLGGVFHLIDRGTGKRRVVDPGGEAYDPQLSPDGDTIAFVRDGDLWTVSGGGGAKQLTKHPEGFEYGVAEFAAQEELGRRRGYWWSPDSKAIAFQRTDQRPVDTIYVSDTRHPEKPPVAFKYPRAGTNNAIVDLGVVAASGGTPRWLTWDRELAYLADVEWPKQGPLTAFVMDRDQVEVRVLAFDTQTGTSRTLLTEKDDAWINVNVGVPTWLEDGSGFLWMTEASGSWVLELRKADGTLARALTTPDFGLRHVIGIDGTHAYVKASADPLRQDIYRIPLVSGPPEKLTASNGVAGGSTRGSTIAAHGVVAGDLALADGGKSWFALRGTTRHEIPSAAEKPRLQPTTVLETVELGGRTHHVAITRPRTFAKGRTYPVLLKVYGGPHAVMVEAARDNYVMDQWYADAGFIVIRSDNRGTPNRGRAWERSILKDLITIPLADQVDALQALGKRHPELDLARVGIFGWSFGGYVAALAVLLRPDVFKAAVAGAPVTDWALYDTAYTERYMKTPQQNAEGYKATSALTHADKLERPLLIIHGITDDNVHFAHSLALIESLYVAGKRAEVITISATHMVPDPKLNLARELVQVRFFRQHLGASDPASR
ncbi:MAG TPA: DPP IV N-terminal domain-containing protein [Kofleriaceae bacterium]